MDEWIEGLKDNTVEFSYKLKAKKSSQCPNANSASTVPQCEQTSSVPASVEIFFQRSTKKDSISML
jgi:hypothetical protein